MTVVRSSQKGSGGEEKEKIFEKFRKKYCISEIITTFVNLFGGNAVLYLTNPNGFAPLKSPFEAQWSNSTLNNY